MTVPKPLICDWCGEEIKEGEKSSIQPANLHGECAVRSVIGSLGHQLHVCSCYLQSPFNVEDPPGITPREAAKMAEAYWRQKYENRKADRQRLHATLENVLERTALHCGRTLYPPNK